MGNVYPQSVLSKNKKNIIFHLKIIVFTAVKNCCILHRDVIVMCRQQSTKAFYNERLFHDVAKFLFLLVPF